MAKKKAVVLGVGAERGLGAAASRRFAKEGYHVLVAGRTAANIGKVAETIRTAGGTATPVVTDGTREADIAALFDKLPFDTVKDFAPVSMIGAVPHIILVNPSLPVRTVPELIRLARARPGEINYSSPGNGTPLHLAAELLKVSAGINLTHVAYKGAQPAMVSLMSGEGHSSTIFWLRRWMEQSRSPI